MGGERKLRHNPGSAWWTYVEKVTADGNLKALQPSLESFEDLLALQKRCFPR
jgi:hypothetical protein